VDDKMRGRVMSFYSMAFLGMAPFGNLMLGGIAETFEVPAALLVAGAACLAGGILFSSRLPAIIRATREKSAPPTRVPEGKS
jgi:hypothetical protein